MKRKIALLLAAVMTVAMLPMNAMADSSASLSRSGLTFQTDRVVVRNADITIDEISSPSAIDKAQVITLDIRPTSGVIEYGDKIILRVNNGKFDESLTDYAKFNYHGALDTENPDLNTNASTFFKGLDENGVNGLDAACETLSTYLEGHGSSALPYRITIVNQEEAEVELFPLPAKYVNSNNSLGERTGYPTYKIVLPITTEDSDEGDLTISVDGNGTAISDINDRKVATVTDSDGSTTVSVVQSDVKTYSDDEFTLPDITIREDLAGTFAGTVEDPQDIEVRVNGNYDIIYPYSYVDDRGNTHSTEAKPGVNSYSSAPFSVEQTDDRTLVIHVVNGRSIFNTSTLSTIVLSNVRVRARDDDTYGDVNVTVSGDTGISTQTIKVAERQDYGFKLEALEEPTIIYSGRTPWPDSTKYPFTGDSDEDDFVSAEFEFGETSPGAWLTGRKLEFSVPENVKIVGYEITKKRYFENSNNLFVDATITDDGSTLRFGALKDTGSEPNGKDAAYFDIKLYLVASIDFTGDCAVSVSGAGLDADMIDDLVIAKFVTPVTVEATPTKSNMGYKSVETGDIKIIENSAGALGDDNEVEIWLDSTYDSDIAFDDANIDYTIDGEVEIKNFKVRSDRNASGNMITFTVDSESYSAPSTITITGVAVGTTRSIPYGNYSVNVGGDAIVDNYLEDIDTPSSYTVRDSKIEAATKDVTVNDKIVKEKVPYDMFEDDGFEFKDYLQIVTDTTTLDGVVEVTIGEKSIKMNGQSYDMDVAAYIQTSSNSTMVPLRFVTLALGVDQASIADADNTSKIAWDANTKTATIFYAAGSGQKIIQFTAGSPTMRVDGVDITMENGVVSEIVDGRMFVPFRALGQALGVPVSWNADTRTAIYNEQLAATDTDNSAEEPAEANTEAAEETTEAAAEETTAAAE